MEKTLFKLLVSEIKNGNLPAITGEGLTVRQGVKIAKHIGGLKALYAHDEERVYALNQYLIAIAKTRIIS